MVGKGRSFQSPVPKPACFDKMLAAAELLGRDLDYVRADFYSTGDRFYFGELTATGGGGRDIFHPPEFDEWFGHLWRPHRRLFPRRQRQHSTVNYERWK